MEQVSLVCRAYALLFDEFLGIFSFCRLYLNEIYAFGQVRDVNGLGLHGLHNPAFHVENADLADDRIALHKQLVMCGIRINARAVFHAVFNDSSKVEVAAVCQGNAVGNFYVVECVSVVGEYYIGFAAATQWDVKASFGQPFEAVQGLCLVSNLSFIHDVNV